MHPITTSSFNRAVAAAEAPDVGGRVVYGDTDSLFVMLPGRTKQQAFEIGNRLADAVSAAEPNPVELELEKVCIVCVCVRVHIGTHRHTCPHHTHTHTHTHTH